MRTGGLRTALTHRVGRCASCCAGATRVWATLQGPTPALLLCAARDIFFSAQADCTSGRIMAAVALEQSPTLKIGQWQHFPWVKQQCGSGSPARKQSRTGRAGAGGRGGERPWARTGSGPWRPRAPRGPSSCCGPPAPPAAGATVQTAAGKGGTQQALMSQGMSDLVAGNGYSA